MDFIHTHRWQPPEGERKQPHGVYLLHGTGEHAARYQRLAARLVKLGFCVGAHDHPGHGNSTGVRGVIDPPGSLVTQSAIQFQAFARETGSTPILFGHSLGGVIAAELVLIHRLPVMGLILSAPAFVPHISLRNRIRLSVLSQLAPLYAVDIPYDASRLTSDENEQRLANADPLNHGVKSASLVNWLKQAGRRVYDQAEQLNVETLLLIAGSDPVIDSNYSRIFAKRCSTDLLTVHEYEGYRHEILNETPERRNRVMRDIENWLLRDRQLPD